VPRADAAGMADAMIEALFFLYAAVRACYAVPTIALASLLQT
jgi:hypothetical protein